MRPPLRGWRETVWHPTRLLLGGILALAAGLKFIGSAVDPVPGAGWFASIPAQLLLVEYEILIAAWLVSGLMPVAARFVAAVTFTVFAGVSFSAAVNGRPSCGCLGAADVNPWVMFAVDATAVVLLILSHPIPSESPPFVRHAARLAFGSAAVFAAGVASATVWYGSVGVAVGRAWGKVVAAEPTIAAIGTGLPGERIDGTVQLVNYSERPVRIIGGVSDCSCVATRDLPATIPPRGRIDLRIAVNPGHAPGGWFKSVNFLTDDDRSPIVVVGLTGTVEVDESQSLGGRP